MMQSVVIQCELILPQLFQGCTDFPCVPHDFLLQSRTLWNESVPCLAWIVFILNEDLYFFFWADWMNAQFLTLTPVPGQCKFLVFMSLLAVSGKRQSHKWTRACSEVDVEHQYSQSTPCSFGLWLSPTVYGNQSCLNIEKVVFFICLDEISEILKFCIQLTGDDKITQLMAWCVRNISFRFWSMLAWLCHIVAADLAAVQSCIHSTFFQRYAIGLASWDWGCSWGVLNSLCLGWLRTYCI